ncbi:hypothetical protein EDB85DRAFT_1936441 [Lactarius pseudohatsudake]|nr:hypothetical protein EDB85DRAFT_1936441 [Lactarius pseudohatsudake]
MSTTPPSPLCRAKVPPRRHAATTHKTRRGPLPAISMAPPNTARKTLLHRQRGVQMKSPSLMMMTATTTAATTMATTLDNDADDTNTGDNDTNNDDRPTTTMASAQCIMISSFFVFVSYRLSLTCTLRLQYMRKAHPAPLPAPHCSSFAGPRLHPSQSTTTSPSRPKTPTDTTPSRHCHRRYPPGHCHVIRPVLRLPPRPRPTQ